MCSSDLNVRSKLDVAVRGADGDRAELAAVRAELQAALDQSREAAVHFEGNKVRDLEERLAQIQAEHSRAIAEAMARARTSSHESEVEAVARLRAAIRSLDDAGSLSEVLDRLAEHAASEAERAALLVVRGQRLAGWHLSGFAQAPSVARTVDVVPSEATLLQRACETGGVVYEDGDMLDPETAIPTFARDLRVRHAVAVPVTVGGEVVAVLYADATRADGNDGPATWPAALEMLAAHASRNLEARTLQRAVGLAPSTRAAAFATPDPVVAARVATHDAEVRH